MNAMIGELGQSHLAIMPPSARMEGEPREGAESRPAVVPITVRFFGDQVVIVDDAAHGVRSGLPRGASIVSIDGKPVAPEVIGRLGQWRGFRPNFSALPGNLAATFQPEGDGLGSAENPLDPQVGDLRIDWRELTLPPLADKVERADRSLGDQLRRAATSVALNVGEARGRAGNDARRVFRIARGELEEARVALRAAVLLRRLGDAEVARALALADREAAMLYRLAK